jgi:hypothetical protein
MSDEPFTADRGQIIVEDPLRGQLWRGRRGDLQLVVALSDFGYRRDPAFFDRWFRFDIPGIAPLAFLGLPDDAPPNIAMLAEVRPAGEPLATIAPLSEELAIELGIALCDVLRAWIAARGSAFVGLHPDTLYVADNRYAGATPRVFALLGNGDVHSSFDPAYYGGPLGPSESDLGDGDAAFVVALLVWFAATGEHAIRAHHYLDAVRPAFGGSATLGAVLERGFSGASLGELREALSASLRE